MCGRYLLDADVRRLEAAFGEFSQKPRALPLRFNIAPTQPVPIVRRAVDGGRELVVRWGLIPGWAKDAAVRNRLINARAEGIGDKPAFRAAFRSRRCIVPATGFYKWKRDGRGPKRPFVIRRMDREPMGLAGLWESWRDPGTGEAVESCAMVTCPPNELMAELHDRMPVILAPATMAAGWKRPPRPRPSCCGPARRGGWRRRRCRRWSTAPPTTTPASSRPTASPRPGRPRSRKGRCSRARRPYRRHLLLGAQ
jgi:putative SOS response-associated peptidase YedK